MNYAEFCTGVGGFRLGIEMSGIDLTSVYANEIDDSSAIYLLRENWHWWSVVKKAGMGFLAMKALAGGLITNTAAAYVFMLPYDHVLPIWGVQFEWQLDQFLSYQDQEPVMDAAMKTEIEKDLEELQGEFCRGCGYCMPCPVDINISDCARMSLMIRRAPAQGQLTPAMQAMMKKTEDCIHCGKCKSMCPYGLDTPTLLEKNYQDYKEILAGKEI